MSYRFLLPFLCLCLFPFNTSVANRDTARAHTNRKQLEELRKLLLDQLGTSREERQRILRGIESPIRPMAEPKQSPNEAPKREAPKKAPIQKGPIPWVYDLEAAKKEAAKTGKKILVNFTQTDSNEKDNLSEYVNRWVFGKKEFYELNKDKYIFVQIDYNKDTINKLIHFGRLVLGDMSLTDKQVEEKMTAPGSKWIEQAAALKKQYDRIRNEHFVTRYPTVLLLDSEGRPYAHTGIVPKAGAELYNPKGYSNHLNSFEEGLKKRNRFFEAATDLTGKKKAEKLLNGIEAVQPGIRLNRSYFGTLDQIIKSSPKGKLGDRARFERAKILYSEKEMAEDYRGAVSDMENYLKTEPPGEYRQKVLKHKSLTHRHQMNAKGITIEEHAVQSLLSVTEAVKAYKADPTSKESDEIIDYIGKWLPSTMLKTEQVYLLLVGMELIKLSDEEENKERRKKIHRLGVKNYANAYFRNPKSEAAKTAAQEFKKLGFDIEDFKKFADPDSLEPSSK